MRIGFIGSGDMARTLGKLWAANGHDVFVSSREPGKAAPAAEFVGGRHGTFADAAAFAEVVVLAVRWDGVFEAVDQAGPLAGKVLVDCNNAVDHEKMELQTGFAPSYAERIAEKAGGARVVKAFNTVFQEVFAQPTAALRDRKLSCFLCGDDADAKATVGRLAAELGFDPVDCGPLEHARLVEAAGALIIWLGWKGGLGPTAAMSAVTFDGPPDKDLGGRQ